MCLKELFQMRMHSNTIFITGGSSGIGQGLAEAFHQLGNQVIIISRRKEVLKDICTRNSGMRYFVLDVTDPKAISSVARQVIQEFPALNCVFNNAGVQNAIDVSGASELAEQALVEEVHANLLGVIRVAGAFLPHLKRQENAVLMNVSSGLAFVPLARFPVYCATKAATHSYTLSLRHQLRGSGVKVIELIPPYVATNLGGSTKRASNPNAPQPMPLLTFIAETMKELTGDADEIAIGPSKNLLAASGLDNVKKAFAGMNG